MQDQPPNGTETWTIDEVARLAGVTSRTLRHYDAIGLLRPVGTAAGGRRLYGHGELLTLQQILLLRELGVPLAAVREILDADRERSTDEPTTTRTTRLREHHTALLTERDRLDRLAATVSATIGTLEKGQTMAAHDLYDGFDHRQYEAEVRERWGGDAWARSTAQWKSLGTEGRAALEAEIAVVSDGLATLMTEGADATDERVQALVARHYATVAVFWSPDVEAYENLAQMYTDDPRFAKHYDDVAPGLARYLRDAVAVWAPQNLN